MTRLEDWLHRPVPAARAASLRIVIGAFAVGYLVARAPDVAGVGDLPASHWRPVGLGHALPGGPLGTPALWGLWAVGVATGAAFTAGWRHRVAGPLFAVTLLFLLGNRSSYGQVFHTEHLLVLHVMALAASSSVVTVGSVDAGRSAGSSAAAPGADPVVDGWAVRLAGVLTVVTYVVAGVTKLRVSGWQWADGENLRRWVAYDNLRKIELGDVHSPLGGWLVAHGWIFVPIAVATLLVELGAPVALLGGRPARWWAAAAWSFHVGVLAVMAILFVYPLSGLAYLPLLAAERVPGVLRLGAALESGRVRGMRRALFARPGP